MPPSWECEPIVVIKPFVANNYWSATENNTSNSWNVNFSNGNTNSNNKTNNNRVRCVREYFTKEKCQKKNDD